MLLECRVFTLCVCLAVELVPIYVYVPAVARLPVRASFQHNIHSPEHYGVRSLPSTLVRGYLNRIIH